VYNRGSIQRIIDRKLASSSDQYSGGQTGSQPPVEDQYNRGGFIVYKYNRGLILRMIDRHLASSS
jgi:hypothetical protein